MKKGGGITALSDPMVYMEVDGVVARTSVINQTLNPVWDDDDQEVFVFRVLILQVAYCMFNSCHFQIYFSVVLLKYCFHFKKKNLQ
jgi:hypothetical protein